jgi:RNase adapter protein RapZ
MASRGLRGRARETSSGARFIVVTGLSGAGKSQAIRALEDLGYFCVDNLPVALIPTFADLARSGHGALSRAAVVVDIREGGSLSDFPAAYRRLKRRASLRTALIFLEAQQPVLVRRFSETRRPHPLARDRSASEGLQEERRRLEPIRQLADKILDTSRLSVHELRRAIHNLVGGSSPATPLTVNVLSFGFKQGVPADADLVFDVRFLPNPYFVETLRPLTGQNPRVSRYVMRADAARKFLRLTAALLQFLLPQYIEEGKSYLTVAIGCTGGKHRSVAIAETLARRLGRVGGTKLRVRHRDIDVQ